MTKDIKTIDDLLLAFGKKVKQHVLDNDWHETPEDIAESKAQIEELIRQAREDELNKITNARGLHAATFDYVTRRARELNRERTK